ncbi:hypothetical protein PsYK624_101420 [Phanerochaete sordida]|uniref:Uncharacterized protein n=1 Tax=Phanerochaete sordida TaxID=48140 RepID=A0A9P3GHW7_9APHY|nr:hypothetical protein PsYK624_101420 [Phanerochaete sordida]
MRPSDHASLRWLRDAAGCEQRAKCEPARAPGTADPGNPSPHQVLQNSSSSSWTYVDSRSNVLGI